VTRSLSAIAVGVVVPALVFGGCSGDPKPKFAPSESSSPVASVSPSHTERALPPRAEQAKFLREYFAEVSASISTGDASGFLALSSPRCESCAVIAKNLDQAYDDGGSIRGGSWTVSSPTYSGKSSLGPVWDIDVATAREHWFDGDGTEIKIVRPSTQHVSVALESDRGAWRVREMRLQ
jgi:hypothetical protein